MSTAQYSLSKCLILHRGCRVPCAAGRLRRRATGDARRAGLPSARARLLAYGRLAQRRAGAPASGEKIRGEDRVARAVEIIERHAAAA